MCLSVNHAVIVGARARCSIVVGLLALLAAACGTTVSGAREASPAGASGAQQTGPESGSVPRTPGVSPSTGSGFAPGATSSTSTGNRGGGVGETFSRTAPAVRTSGGGTWSGTELPVGAWYTVNSSAASSGATGQGSSQSGTQR